jgi:hypothetical protein
VVIDVLEVVSQPGAREYLLCEPYKIVRATSPACLYNSLAWQAADAALLDQAHQQQFSA